MPLVPQDLRIDYGRGQLARPTRRPTRSRSSPGGSPTPEAAKVPEPNAMTVATADADGRPSARVVLLKSFDERGFAFFTNYESRKGRDLAANPRAALCFYWQPLERQVRVEGAVERVSRAESEAYFRTGRRPPGSGRGRPARAPCSGPARSWSDTSGSWPPGSATT
jgi:pyridoxamine 5'-phosphate oxidase